MKYKLSDIPTQDLLNEIESRNKVNESEDVIRNKLDIVSGKLILNEKELEGIKSYNLDWETHSVTVLKIEMYVNVGL